jgi:hypothetical protein
MMRNVNYELIGSVPSMEVFRDSLDTLMAEYLANVPPKTVFDELMSTSPANRANWVKEKLTQPAAAEQMVRGVTIELCAQHFYGLTGSDFDRVTNLIDEIRSMDQDLEVK